MFTQISWTTYLITVALVLAPYYLVIVYRFYRFEILNLFSGKQAQEDYETFTPERDFALQQLRGTKDDNALEDFEKQNLFPLAQAFADELQAFLEESGKDKITKTQLTQSLRILVAKYPSLKDSSFDDFVINLIKTESETNCSIHLTDEEVNALWN